MNKETFYFSHDYNSRNDVKIKKLLSKHGLLGYGIFWAIIEELYNNTNVLPLDYDTISYDLRIEKSVLISVIEDFDLFVFNEKTFSSLSVSRRLKEREERSDKARKSVKIRWDKNKGNTNVLQSNYDTNTIKERKEKEIIENKKELYAKEGLIYKYTEYGKDVFIEPKWDIEFTIEDGERIYGNLKDRMCGGLSEFGIMKHCEDRRIEYVK